MKITDIKAYVVNPRNRNYVFVKVETDEGLYGVGEAYSVGPDLATYETIRYFRDWLIGVDPMRIEYVWQLLYNYSRFPGGSVINSAISGIDLALWDLKGKALGVPVYSLLGGPTRDRIWTYAGCTKSGTPEACVDEIHAMKEKYGYTAIKLFQHFAGDIPVDASRKALSSKFDAARKAFGGDMELAIDFHARNFEPYRAVWFAEAIREYRPFFIEEPIRMENIVQMAHLKDKLNAPLATGECLYTKHEFNSLLEADAADILQPDIFLTGGLTEGLKIAAMADAHYKVIAPHNPLSPLSTFINVHYAAAIPNFLVLETHPHNIGAIDSESKLVTDTLTPVDGMLPLPIKPGWGCDLNFDYLETLTYKPWNRPFAKRSDGGIDVV